MYAGRDRKVDPATPWRKNGLGRYADEGSVRGRHYESSEPLSGFSGFGIAPVIVAAGVSELTKVFGKKHTGLPTHYLRYVAAVQAGDTTLASGLLAQARAHAQDASIPDQAQWQLVYQRMLALSSDGGSSGTPGISTPFQFPASATDGSGGVVKDSVVQDVIDAALKTPEGQALVQRYGPVVAKNIVQQQQTKVGDFVGKNLPLVIGGGLLLLFAVGRRR